MTVHIDELRTDVTVDSSESHDGPAGHTGDGSSWDTAATERVDTRRAIEVRERTRSEAFDD